MDEWVQKKEEEEEMRRRRRMKWNWKRCVVEAWREQKKSGERGEEEKEKAEKGVDDRWMGAGV